MKLPAVDFEAIYHALGSYNRPVFVKKFEAAIHGADNEQFEVLNILVEFMKETRSLNPEAAEDMAKSLAELVDAIDKEDLLSQTRMKIALSTAVRGQPSKPNALDHYQETLLGAYDKTSLNVKDHPHAMGTAWWSKLPESQHVIRGQNFFTTNLQYMHHIIVLR